MPTEPTCWCGKPLDYAWTVYCNVCGSLSHDRSCAHRHIKREHPEKNSGEVLRGHE